MRVCKNCERAGTPDKCKVGGSSDRCVECARKTYSCDLAPFSPARWAKLRKERSKKLSEWKEAQAKTSRLALELEVLERKEKEMVEGELQNIDEVEVDEQLAAVNPEDLLFDVSSEQIELPLDFDFSGLVGVAGTPAGVAGSSQGS